jgi:hypothetical protein
VSVERGVSVERSHLEWSNHVMVVKLTSIVAAEATVPLTHRPRWSGPLK